jgi:hypothetical protein
MGQTGKKLSRGDFITVTGLALASIIVGPSLQACVGNSSPNANETDKPTQIPNPETGITQSEIVQILNQSEYLGEMPYSVENVNPSKALQHHLSVTNATLKNSKYTNGVDYLNSDIYGNGSYIWSIIPGESAQGQSPEIKTGNNLNVINLGDYRRSINTNAFESNIQKMPQIIEIVKRYFPDGEKISLLFQQDLIILMEPISGLANRTSFNVNVIHEFLNSGRSFKISTPNGITYQSSDDKGKKYSISQFAVLPEELKKKSIYALTVLSLQITELWQSMTLLPISDNYSQGDLLLHERFNNSIGRASAAYWLGYTYDEYIAMANDLNSRTNFQIVTFNSEDYANIGNSMQQYCSANLS